MYLEAWLYLNEEKHKCIDYSNPSNTWMTTPVPTWKGDISEGSALGRVPGNWWLLREGELVSPGMSPCLVTQCQVVSPYMCVWVCMCIYMYAYVWLNRLRKLLYIYVCYNNNLKNNRDNQKQLSIGGALRRTVGGRGRIIGLKDDQRVIYIY